MKILKTDFDPTQHGYKFINRFDLKQLVPFINLKKRFFLGLCGGMVYSALDLIYANAIRPEYSMVEELPKPFVNYLWKRQSDSVSATTLAKLIIKAVSSNKNNLLETINHEIPLIIESISLNHPVPVVIIRNNFFENPTNNHQVLLVSSEIDGPVTKFTCYDPNHPLISPFIQIDRTYGNESISQSSGEILRGLFINKYKQKTPFI